MDFSLSAEQARVQARAREFAQGRVAPLARELHAQDQARARAA